MENEEVFVDDDNKSENSCYSDISNGSKVSSSSKHSRQSCGKTQGSQKSQKLRSSDANSKEKNLKETTKRNGIQFNKSSSLPHICNNFYHIFCAYDSRKILIFKFELNLVAGSKVQLNNNFFA